MKGRVELSGILCLVIHHRNYPEVIEVVKSITLAGIPSDSLIVVDNSEDSVIFDKLQLALRNRAHVVCVKNAGYAHAINEGVRHAVRIGIQSDYTLIATHEVEVAPDAITILKEALDTDTAAMVAGPTLLHYKGSELRVWSLGGRLTKWLNKPKHIGAGISVDAIRGVRPILREWLDGAFCMYRTPWISDHPLREDYFLGFEELDYHTSIRRAGAHILWCPQAIVCQRANGISPYLLGRNLQKFENTHGNFIQRIVVVPTALGANTIRMLARRPGAMPFKPLLKGWLAALGLGNDDVTGPR